MCRQGVRPPGRSGCRAQEPAGVPPRARGLPEVAPGGGDYSQRVIRLRPEGGAFTGLRPHQGAEGSARGKICRLYSFISMWEQRQL